MVIALASINEVNQRRARLVLRWMTVSGFKQPDILLRAFAVYVRPILEYCSAVWNPGYLCDINKIESVQRRFTKRLKAFHSLSYVDRLKTLNTESLELRRLKTDLVTMYKILFSSCCGSFQSCSVV